MSPCLKMPLRKIFWTFLCLQLLLWTLVPTLVRLSLPMDAIEGYVWGQHFQWGYDRDPWMNALLTHIAVSLGGKSGWLVYACSQLFVCLGYWSIWKLSHRIFHSETYALVATLSLIGVQYTSLATTDFNDNVIELGLWPLLIYLGYEAFIQGKLRFWILGGIVAGLALMSKYYSIVPLSLLILFFCFEPQARKYWKTPGPYLAGGLIFLICLPHLLWLPEHHFITIEYADLRVRTSVGRFHHIYYALRFSIIQLLVFLGPLTLIGLAIFPRKSQSPSLNIPKSTQNFLNFTIPGVFLGTIAISIIFTWKLNTLWGTPLLSLWPLWILAKYQPPIAHLLRMLVIGGIIFLLLLTGYAIHNLRDQGSPENLDGKRLSENFLAHYEKSHDGKLPTTLKGNRYFMGYVAFYAPEPISVEISEN